MNPFKYGPRYAALSELPLAERVAQMRRDEVRAAILAEAPDSNRASTTLDRIPAPLFEHLFPLGDELEYEPTSDQSVAAVAARDGLDPWAVMYDLLLGADGREFLLRPLLNYGRGSYDGLHDMMLDPASVQGLGDGGAHSLDRVRREHDDVHAHALGARSQPRPAPAARVRGEAAHRRMPRRCTASATGACWHRACAPTST